MAPRSSREEPLLAAAATEAEGHAHAHAHEQGHAHAHEHGHEHEHEHGHAHGGEAEHGDGAPRARAAADGAPARAAPSASSLASERKLKLAMALAILFMLVEIVGGVLAGSLAVLTDAAHMLSDVAGFFVSIVSLYITAWPQTAQFSYGYHRAEVLGAIFSIFAVWFMTGILVYESINRLVRPEKVDGLVMGVTALLGVLLNLVLMKVLGGHGGHAHGHSHAHGHGLFGAGGAHAADAAGGGEHGHGGHGHGGEHAHAHAHGHGEGAHDAGHEHAHGHEHEHGAALADAEAGGAHAAAKGAACADEEGGRVAVRAAMAHVIGDLIQSIGVVIAAALIYFLHDRWPDPTGLSYWYRVDPVCTLLFAVLVMMSTYGTIKDCTLVLMCAAPPGIDPARAQAALELLPGVLGVHDLHIWAIAPSKVNLTAHLVVSTGTDVAPVLYAAQAAASRFGCHHTVFQVEDEAAFVCQQHNYCDGRPGCGGP